jgi:hypothetical protein
MHAELIRKIRPWEKVYLRTNASTATTKYNTLKDGKQSAPVKAIKRLLSQTNRLLKEISLNRIK